MNVVPGLMPADPEVSETPPPLLHPGVVGFPGGMSGSGSCLVFAGAWFCSFDPKNSPPSPGLLSARVIPVAQLLFSKTHPCSHLHGQLGRRRRCGPGGVEQMKFSKEGEPQLVLTLRKGDSLLANLSPHVGSPAPPAPGFFL